MRVELTIADRKTADRFTICATALEAFSYYKSGIQKQSSMGVFEFNPITFMVDSLSVKHFLMIILKIILLTQSDFLQFR